jgi:PIN domain nuclease of toxin-antitoxin system
MAVDRRGCGLQEAQAAAVILLDTNALLWLDTGHRRARVLSRWAGRLFVSPATLLELSFLLEVGRIKARAGEPYDPDGDPRWLVDEPPAGAWFAAARELSWTRDPFDRLIVAHARSRGLRLATGDAALLDRLNAREVVAL